MRLSQAVSDVLLTTTVPERGIPPLQYIRGIFQRIMFNAGLYTKGDKKQIGPTDPLFGEREETNRIKQAHASRENQFPANTKLPDGRHRYFKKYGMLVDRLAV